MAPEELALIISPRQVENCWKYNAGRIVNSNGATLALADVADDPENQDWNQLAEAVNEWWRRDVQPPTPPPLRHYAWRGGTSASVSTWGPLWPTDNEEWDRY